MTQNYYVVKAGMSQSLTCCQRAWVNNGLKPLVYFWGVMPFFWFCYCVFGCFVP